MSAAIQSGTPLAWEIRGHGEPVLLFVHGWGCDRLVWDALRPLLEPRFATATFDARGFGASEDALGDPATWSLAMAADDITAIVAAMAPRRVVVVGASMQGVATLAMASRPPANLEAVVAIGAAPRYANGEGYELGADAAMLAAVIGQLRADYVGTCERLVPSFWLTDADQAATSRALAHVSGAARRTTRPEAATTILERAYAEDIRALLPAVTVPVLLIHGDRDVVAPLAVGEFLLGRLPNARLSVIPDAGHLPHLTCPALVAEAIAAFFC